MLDSLMNLKLNGSCFSSLLKSPRLISTLQCVPGHTFIDVKAPSCLKVRLARLVLRQVLIEKKSLRDIKDS